MSGNSTEQEVKFYIQDLAALEARVAGLANQVMLIQPRTHELNLRFDTPTGDLQRTHQVLRLRRDEYLHLTYKGPSSNVDGVCARSEIEFIVGDFQAARAFLEALGYQVYVIYEKYRTIYQLGEAMVFLDELPIGNFCEIEAGDPHSIRQTAMNLDLDWNHRFLESYLWLFEGVKNVLGLSFRDMTFENFADVNIPPAAIISHLEK